LRKEPILFPSLKVPIMPPVKNQTPSSPNVKVRPQEKATPNTPSVSTSLPPENNTGERLQILPSSRPPDEDLLSRSAKPPPFIDLLPLSFPCLSSPAELKTTTPSGEYPSDVHMTDGHPIESLIRGRPSDN
jgi:hypothetical protein